MDYFTFDDMSLHFDRGNGRIRVERCIVKHGKKEGVYNE